MAKKASALSLLMESGVFQTEHEATAHILSGQVFAGGERVRSAGQLLQKDAQLTVRGRTLFAGKGGFKLAGALDAFSISPEGRVCIDAGASTGGFTDCLVQRGARLVYAVDVGYGQLAGKLRQDARVRNLERTNISDEKLLSLDPTPDLGTIDVSYLSLRKAIPAFQSILRNGGELACLVKPLFETDDMDARRTGELPDTAYAPLLAALIADINGMPGLSVANVTHSPVTGNAGTREFFLHVLLEDKQTSDLTREIATAVEAALSLPVYERMNA